MSTQSFQYFMGITLWNLRAFAKLRMCWCFLSTIELCCRVSTQDIWCTTPFSTKNVFHIEFSSIVTSDYLDFIFKLVFNHIIKSLQSNTSIKFIFQSIDPSTSSIIFHYCYEISWAIIRNFTTWSPKITME